MKKFFSKFNFRFYINKLRCFRSISDLYISIFLQIRKKNLFFNFESLFIYYFLIIKIILFASLYYIIISDITSRKYLLLKLRVRLGKYKGKTLYPVFYFLFFYLFPFFQYKRMRPFVRKIDFQLSSEAEIFRI